MDILPAHIAVQVAVEKYLVLAYQDYQRDLNSKTGEKPLELREAKQLGIAALMLSIWERSTVADSDTDSSDILYVLPHLTGIPYVEEEDLEVARRYFMKMLEFNVIRENVSMLDFVAERAWWAMYQAGDYSSDSALTGFLGGLLTSYQMWCQFEVRCIEQ